MAKLKRAYSEKEKHEREQKIIDSAQQLLMAKSYSTINMSEIARTAELAKGTVYLYFQTKEELFLALFERKFGLWLDQVKSELSALPTPSEKSQIIDILVRNTTSDHQLIRLSALSNLIFEHNISYEKARNYKLWLYQHIGDVGTILEDKLKLQAGQGVQLLYRLYVFVIGLENVANPAPVTQAVYDNEPSLTHPDFESELRALVTMLFNSLD